VKENTAWDRQYSRRGELWGGAADGLPALPEGSEVLELGCGNGKTLSAMTGRSWQITGLDFSAEAVALCSRITGPRLLTADVRHLPFRDETFDAVFAFHITGHLEREDREMMAEEITRVLRRGGRLFFRGFGRGDMRCGKGTETEEATFRRGDGIITHYFTEEETEDLFSGLRAISVRTDTWNMRIRGRDYPRAEIWAELMKP